MQLLQREAEREDALGLLGGKIARQAFLAQRREFLAISIVSFIHAVE